MPAVRVQRLDPDLPLPEYAHPGDAGCDVVSAVDIDLAPGERGLVPTGIAIAVPQGYACFVHPRSGLAIRNGVTMLNAPGTIDSGYRGEVKVIVVNHDPHDTFVIKRGDRIAQLVFQPVMTASFVEASDLDGDRDAPRRGTGGFGSTGITQQKET